MTPNLLWVLKIRGTDQSTNSQTGVWNFNKGEDSNLYVVYFFIVVSGFIYWLCTNLIEYGQNQIFTNPTNVLYFRVLVGSIPTHPRSPFRRSTFLKRVRIWCLPISLYARSWALEICKNDNHDSLHFHIAV